MDIFKELLLTAGGVVLAWLLLAVLLGLLGFTSTEEVAQRVRTGIDTQRSFRA